MSHVSITRTIADLDVLVGIGGDNVIISCGFTGAIDLSLPDAQGLYEKLGQVLATIERSQAPAATPTESGMTELDCALLRPAREGGGRRG